MSQIAPRRPLLHLEEIEVLAIVNFNREFSFFQVAAMFTFFKKDVT